MCTLEFIVRLFLFQEGEVKDVGLGFVGLKVSADSAELEPVRT